MPKSAPVRTATAQDTTVDLLVIGSGTGMAAALAAAELGSSVLIAEKTAYVGGSTARSGGAFWIPDNPILREAGAPDSPARAAAYVDAVVGDTSPRERWQSFLDNGTDTVDMLRRTTPMRFMWDKEYSDYQPEQPGGSAIGRSCECIPFDANRLGTERARLRGGTMEAPLPMPITGKDYRWLNLLAKVPAKGFPTAVRRAVQGIGGLALKRDYVAGGQALAAGLFAGVLKAGIPVWTETSLVRLISDGGRVTGAVLEQDGTEVTVTARQGVVLAAGGFDHDMALRHKHQSPALEGWSFGAEGNTGDAIKAGVDAGAGTALLDQAWWFPAVAPLPGAAPSVMLAERSLPGSFIVDDAGKRFVNEAENYMSFGQHVLEREKQGDPVGTMWMIFDQEYRNSYLLAGALYPRSPLPAAWYEAGIAAKAGSLAELARSIGVPEDTFTATAARFNEVAAAGVDEDFHRGSSAYDRYYGDPTIRPNPNLRPLSGKTFYAVKMVLSDLGTCGGLTADARGRVLREDGTVLEGLYAIGNTAANVFGKSYPGAGATIGQGLVYGYIAARDAAGKGAPAAAAGSAERPAGH
ncbi:3-ketosteroid-delta-1-dehydrogenase [Arthrobacter sp. zg-Y20]|uniref:3-ketosteroid-delta-1-dehydrogenase n=1 Tax=unclassified Arthrobacter TaxID=235627 RepID=UPI001D14A94C|nr:MULTISPECIES: 3-ketosteroid-delta-1-dehydrogenase [unclassified Arthrobacter]MCC3274433.1 3-ketosteroid-delta-1-dehydrogenase [Arthrobacter sp. zg-Y20]MDK1314589.1 3-ketosteroid-delta-1-dehydrogenase [Arthrobacter sp. zg.Y20]WIB07572.1 3-ketosteroid-delta-1-dehydrogenase [Arthrobacter sp. zg-Y20]